MSEGWLEKCFARSRLHTPHQLAQKLESQTNSVRRKGIAMRCFLAKDPSFSFLALWILKNIVACPSLVTKRRKADQDQEEKRTYASYGITRSVLIMIQARSKNRATRSDTRQIERERKLRREWDHAGGFREQQFIRTLETWIRSILYMREWTTSRHVLRTYRNRGQCRQGIIK